MSRRSTSETGGTHCPTASLWLIAFLAAGLFQAATEHLRLVVRGGEERVELERVLAMRTVGQQARSVSVTQGRHDGGRRRELRRMSA